MARIFWDTSALVRGYAPGELGGDRVERAIADAAGNVHAISRLLPTELASALALKTRMGALGAAERDESWALFLGDLDKQYQVAELSESTWELAQQLLFRHALRAGDAIHLAAAILAAPAALGELIFWTADRRQAEAAQAEGLQVELVG